MQVDIIGKEEPLSEEKLCPVLAMYRARDFDDAIAKADKLVGWAGKGRMFRACCCAGAAAGAASQQAILGLRGSKQQWQRLAPRPAPLPRPPALRAQVMLFGAGHTSVLCE